jgi:hypothetical protein
MLTAIRSCRPIFGLPAFCHCMFLIAVISGGFTVLDELIGDPVDHECELQLPEQ